MEKKKKILLTGSSGFFGSEIFKLLKKKYRCESINRDNLKSTKNLEEIILKKLPEIIINTASIVGLNNSNINKNETKNINSRLPYNLAKFSEKFNFHLIHISTQSIFDGNLKKDLYENTKPNPISFYGYTKYLGEKNIIFNTDNFTIIRFPYIYSNNFKNPRNILSKIFLDINNDKVKIFKKERSSLISMKSAVKTIDDIIINNAKGIFHASDIGTFDWFELIKFISKVLKKKIKINIKNIKKRENHTVLKSYNCFYGYNSWKNGVREAVKQNNYD